MRRRQTSPVWLKTRKENFLKRRKGKNLKQATKTERKKDKKSIGVPSVILLLIRSGVSL
jgi:hypothetical protein